MKKVLKYFILAVVFCGIFLPFTILGIGPYFVWRAWKQEDKRKMKTYAMATALFYVFLGIVSASSSSSSVKTSKVIPEPKTLIVQPTSSAVMGVASEVKQEEVLEPTEKPVLTTSKPHVMAAPAIKTNTNTSGHSCSGPDLDCSDFASHAQAQTFFDSCGFTATNDPMRLDGSGNKVDDGVACESLP